MKKVSLKSLSINECCLLTNREKKQLHGGLLVVGPIPPITINPCSLMRCPIGYVCVTWGCSTGNTGAKCVKA